MQANVKRRAIGKRTRARKIRSAGEAPGKQKTSGGRRILKGRRVPKKESKVPKSAGKAFKSRKVRKWRKNRRNPRVGMNRKLRKKGFPSKRRSRTGRNAVLLRKRTAKHGPDYAGQPDGYYRSTKAWLASRYGKEGLRERYKEFYKDDVTYLTDSIGVGDHVHGDFRAGVVKGKPAFAAVIEGGRVWEKNGAVITPDNMLLADISWDLDVWRLEGRNHNVFKRWHEPALMHVPETSGLLTYIWSGNYFHWLYDILPRVDLLRRSGVPIEKYVVPRDCQAIQDETLNLLGVPPHLRIEAHRGFHARFDRLVVPSFVKSARDHPSEYPKWVTEFLRNEFLYTKDVPRSDEYERIYVSRARAWQRRILNEEEVGETLQRRGIRAVTLEGMPFTEQVRIFSSAKVIVGPHGAGLSNLVFCSPGAKVVEMQSPVYVNNYFWHLSNQMALEHYHLIGDYHVKPANTWKGSADFHVDIGKLDRLLQKAGI